jgi:uncharacterized RDD family membrane protein YckC
MTTIQPYPFATAQASAGGSTLARAGFWRRFGAHFLDGIVINICTLPLGFAHSAWVSLVGFIVVFVAYYTSLEGGDRGQTVGKMALGIRVADIANGGAIGYGRAFTRLLGRFVSAIVFLLGYLWMLWDDDKQTWHDKMARSIVVPADAVG